MPTLSKPTETANHSLHSLVSKLSSGFIASTTDRRSLIINNVPDEIVVPGTGDLLATVIGSMLYNLIRHTEFCCIRIDAESTGFNTTIRLKTNRDLSKQYNSGFLNQVSVLAHVIGGIIEMPTGNQRMITFSFPNKLQAA